MPTLVMDPAPVEVVALIEHRRRLGLDHRDEMWEGVYRMNPPPSHEHQIVLRQLAELLGPLARGAGLEPLIQEFGLGTPEDYRVPDGGLHHPGATGVWHPTAALVIEIVSPGDDTWQKLPFYAARHVNEALIIDRSRGTLAFGEHPRFGQQEHAVHWLRLTDDGSEYHPILRSNLIDLGAEELADRIDWPR